jgi:hypothetical protein
VTDVGNVSLAALAEEVRVPGDPSASALALAELLDLTVYQRELLDPLLRDFCAHIDRRHVRSIEREATAQRAGVPVGVPAHQRLLSESFALGDGRRVLWGEATAEEHLERAAMLQQMADGVLRSRQSHIDAADLIRLLGVRCLNDLEVHQ